MSEHVRVRIAVDQFRLYQLVGGSGVYFEGAKRRAWRGAVDNDDGTFTVVIARGTKYQTAVRLPAEAIEMAGTRIANRAKPC